MHIYCPRTKDRGEQEITDTKARITGALTVNALGAFLPTMFIMKHSKSSAVSPNQTGMRVVKNLHLNVDGFKKKDGWVQCTWIKKLVQKNEKDEDVEVEHSAIYLKHTSSEKFYCRRTSI